MIRKIIHINEEKCNGCGACATACHEGAIVMEGGKAKLLRDDYCDGLGNCLPACPTEAITFVEREAAPFNERPPLPLADFPNGLCRSNLFLSMPLFFTKPICSSLLIVLHLLIIISMTHLLQII